MEIEVYTSFDECESELGLLTAQTDNDNPFLRLDWLKSWWAHFNQGKSLYLILCRSEGRVVGFIPFYRISRPALRLNEYFLLGDGLSSYLDMICIHGYEERMADFLFEHFDKMPSSTILHFRDINDRFSRLFLLLSKEAGKDKWLSSCFKLYPCPLATLGSNWDDFFKSQRDRKSRYNLQRSERLFVKVGNLKFREVTNPAELDNLFPQLERIHSERFSQTVNPLFKGQFRSFLSWALANMLASGLSLSVEELDDTPVGFLMGFKMGEVFVDFAPAFDPAFSSLSLGNIHLMRLLAKKTSEGFRYFDFSKGEDRYKRQWSNGETANYLFRFGLNLSPIGRCYYNLLRFKLECIIKLRSKGYNVKIKHLIARLRKWKITSYQEDNYQIEEILIPFDMDRRNLPTWSYKIIRNLPIGVRKSTINFMVKSKIGPFRIDNRPSERTVMMVPEAGDHMYRVRY